MDLEPHVSDPASSLGESRALSGWVVAPPRERCPPSERWPVLSRLRQRGGLPFPTTHHDLHIRVLRYSTAHLNRERCVHPAAYSRRPRTAWYPVPSSSWAERATRALRRHDEGLPPRAAARAYHTPSYFSLVSFRPGRGRAFYFSVPETGGRCTAPAIQVWHLHIPAPPSPCRLPAKESPLFGGTVRSPAGLPFRTGLAQWRRP